MGYLETQVKTALIARMRGVSVAHVFYVNNGQLVDLSHGD